MTNYLQAIEEFARWDWKTGMILPEGYHAKLREAFEKDGPAGFWKKAMEMSSAIDDDRAKYSHYFPAECHARLGDTNRALDRLEQALVNREGASGLVIDEFWDGFRKHPKFQESLERIGLPAKTR